MSELELSFSRWERGQVLLPEHFQAEEEAIVAHAALAARLRGLPLEGFGQLVWDERNLAAGVVVITDLTVVFPSGRMVVVHARSGKPRNATIGNLNLTKLSPPVSEATLHLHLRRRPEAPSATHLDTDPRTVSRVFHELVISTKPDEGDALDSLCIGAVACQELSGKSQWRLLDAYVPPLIQTGNNPFLRMRLAEVATLCAAIEQRLEAQLQDPLFRGERMEAARRCQSAAARLALLLDEYQSDIHPHPYVVFDVIRAFDFELAALEDAPPERVRYRHDDLAGCFDALIRSIRAKSYGAEVASPSLPFEQEREDAPYVAKGFAAELAKATEVFLVVDRVNMERTPLDGVKLASPGRLDDVIRRSLPGVSYHALPSPPPFRHTFGSQVDFYQLDVRGDDWKRAVDAGALAYRATPHLRRVRTALFWRSP